MNQSWTLFGRMATVFIGAIGTLASLPSGIAQAATLPVVTPTVACTDLLTMDFTGLEDAPTKLDSAVVVAPSASAHTEQCVVSGYVAPKVKFTVAMPTHNWTQRLVMNGCGGYCGDLILSFSPIYSTGAATNCPRVTSGELAIASHNGGHVGNLNTARILAAISDGLWAVDDPTALIDFFYASNHKATLAVKAVMAAFYGQLTQYS